MLSISTVSYVAVDLAIMSVHTIKIPYLFVLILQSCCLCCYLFIFNCSVSLYAYHIYMIYMIHMLCVLMFHIVMDIFEITISMINYLLYVIIIMLIYGIKMIWKMPIILTGLTCAMWQWRKEPCSFRFLGREASMGGARLGDGALGAGHAGGWSPARGLQQGERSAMGGRVPAPAYPSQRGGA
jgi:hypothetical protein